MKFSVATYSMGIFDNKKNQYINLDKVIRKGKIVNEWFCFEEIFEEFMKHGKEVGFNSKSLSKILEFSKIEEVEIDNINCFAGLVESGNYGYESTFLDMSTEEKKRFKKPKDTAELMKFFFSSAFPSNSTKAFLILERFNYFGIKIIFSKALNSFFKQFMKQNGVYSEFKHLVIDINGTMPKRYVEDIIDRGNINKLRFISHSKNKEIEDNFGQSKNKDEHYSELIVRKNTPQLKQKLKGLLKKNATIHDLIDFKDYDYDELKVDIRYGNSSKIIDMSDIFKLRAYFDVSDKVKIDLKTGTGTYSSLRKVFVEELQHLLNEFKSEV